MCLSYIHELRVSGRKIRWHIQKNERVPGLSLTSNPHGKSFFMFLMSVSNLSHERHTLYTCMSKWDIRVDVFNSAIIMSQGKDRFNFPVKVFSIS